MKSKKWKINYRELVKGFLIAFLTGTVTYATDNSITNFSQIVWGELLYKSAIPMIAYLLLTLREDNK